MNNINKNEKLSIITYWPLFLVYIISLFLAMYSIKFQEYPDYMSQFMGFILIFFGILKIFDLKSFAESFAKYDPVAKRLYFYGLLYPFFEIFLGIMFILQTEILLISILTIIIYGVSLFGVIKIISKKEEVECVCLGTYFKLPFSKVVIADSVLMIIMCLWMIYMILTMDMSMDMHQHMNM